MKNKLLLSLIVSLFAVTAWADVTIKEAYVLAPTGGAKTTRTPFDGRYTTWYYNSARSKTTDVIGSDRAFWTDHRTNSADNKDCYLETTIEGGLKAVSFKWQQGNGADYPDNLYLGIEINDEQADYIEAASVNTAGAIVANTYSHTFAVKGNNVKLALFNRSTTTRESPTDIGRILIGPITITPYLLYTQKDVTIGLKQKGYYNDELINNTGSEGTISYSSSATGVATVDEYGVITPVSAGDAIITAEWSEGASTTYTLHVVDGILAENFSKVKQTSQTASAEWDGDLFEWEVANVRRGADDTLGLSPRIQATALRNIAGSSLVSKGVIEGGVKHVDFDWRQWASGTTPLTINMYYSADKENWGDAVATQSEDAVGASTPHIFSEDIDNGAKGNAYLRLNYTSGAGVAVLGALKITPWLLYTTKEATLDTRVSLTYTNTGLINNTTGDAPTYGIAPANAAVSINGEGQVAVEDGADVNGDFTITATWGAVTTTYTLHIISRTPTEASYPNAAVRIALDGSIVNALSYTAGYDGTIAYASSNTAVATVNAEGVVSLAGGVGQTTITATLPQTTNYKAASASYNLYVRDNGARIEMFSGVTQSSVVGETLTDWNGDLFTWQAQYQVRRGTNDTIHAGISKHQGTSIGIQNPTGTPLSSILQSKGEVEGGIKYLSFYWMQWGAASGGTRRIAVYADDELIGYQENPNGASGKAGDEFMLGINNAMTSNKQLVIKNESYKGSVGTLSDASNSSRIVLDNIYITPYLLYTNKAHELYAGESYTNSGLINNTESGTITYSLEDNDGEASIDPASGEVTALAAGEVTVKATWSEGAFTTYTLTILSKVVTEASYAESVKRVDLNTLAISNPLVYTEGYDGTITYSSSNTAVATVNQETGAVALKKGVGQATITATLPATENYEAASASYTIYVRDNGARIEDYSNVHIGDGVVGNEGTDWTGVHFDWHVEGAIRHNASDTIWGKTNPDNVKVWIATAASTNETPISAGVMASKDVVEGGIKYLSFYWKQWASESNRTLRIAAFDGETRRGFMEYVPNGASTLEKFLFGVNGMMRNNHVLSIKNESYTTETFDGTIADDGTASKSRLIIDDIYITPYLLYTDKSNKLMRVGEEYTRPIINNTGGETGTLIYSSSNTDVATVVASGENAGQVTAVARGEATITAKFAWEGSSDFVETSYQVQVFPVNCETFSLNATAHTYHTAQYGNSYDNPEPVVEDKCTWYAWLGGVVPSNYEPNIAVIRAPRADEQGPAYLRSGALEGGIASMTFDWNLVDNESNINWDIRVLVNGSEVKQLGNDDLSMTPLTNFGQIEITGINEPGNFVITFENHSTVIGDYPAGKNKARFVIDNVTWTNYEGTKTLSENADNSAWLAANNGETRNVEIVRSALVDGVWNTLCLPFAISKSTDLGGAEVQEMTSAELNGDELTVGFSALAGDELVAGKPYLVKPTSNVNISGTYSDKQITSIASAVSYSIITLQGIFSPYVMTAGDENTLFVGTPNSAGDNLFHPSVDGSLKGFRAYFTINQTAGAPAIRRARFVVNEAQSPTALDESNRALMQDNSKRIENGQLVIIRDGVKYNAIGQKIQ